MGIVYEALDLKLDRRVALKCALPGYHLRLSTEVRAAREVSHFNVCKVHEIHTIAAPDGEIDCLSMEFIEGDTLWQRIDAKGPLSAQEALELTRQICAGLGQAHRQGVIHGDLKSANVILGKSPEGRVRAVITDFGLASLASDPTSTRKAGGTYEYMAPEIFLREPNSATSDIYSLGVLLHVMLTGRVPARKKPLADRPPDWSADSEGSTRTIGTFPEGDWEREIEPLPKPWKGAVAHAMEPLPRKRPASVEAVMRELEPRRWVLKVAAAVVCAAALIAGGRQWSVPVAQTPVRLAVLPFTLEGDWSEATVGMGLEVAERLTGARSKFTVFSPREAERNQATTPEKAMKALGATHVLQVRVRSAAGMMTTNASLIDTRSGIIIRQLQGTYGGDDAPMLAKALVATVSEAFRLPSNAPREAVAPPAYPYYVQGIDLLRADDAANSDRAGGAAY
jgi:TolB-like protein